MKIPGKRYGLLKLRLKRYHGKPLTLSDRTVISKTTLVGELHCDNAAILRLVREQTVDPFTAAREDLRNVARWIKSNALGFQVKGFYGVTILRQRLASAEQVEQTIHWR